MAMNKFMHPKNIYQTPPDFSKLADEFPEIRTVAKAVKLNCFFFSFLFVQYLYKCECKIDFDQFNVHIECKRKGSHRF